MFNARAETLTQLRSFRDLVMTRRCLILNEGFYEHETIGNEKVQWRISPADGEDYFYKAGLWAAWHNPQNGEVIESFTMITCDPTGPVPPHSRPHAHHTGQGRMQTVDAPASYQRAIPLPLKAMPRKTAIL